MTTYEQHLKQLSKRWQQRIVKTNFAMAAVVLIFEVAYYFVSTTISPSDQTFLEYMLRFILWPAIVIFISCIIGWGIVCRSGCKSEAKSLAAILATVAICGATASVHNVFATTLCSFFVPLFLSAVFGQKKITQIVGSCCVIGAMVAMYYSGVDLRVTDPYFLRYCLMLLISFGISWHIALLLLKNEQEKRHMIDQMRQEQNILQQKVYRDELTGLYNMLGLQRFVDEKSSENNGAYLNSSLAFLDLDDFKRVNDTFGHEAGNAAIVYIANCIRGHFPQSSCVARYGGDEFVILLPGVSTLECIALLKSLQGQVLTSPIAELTGSTFSFSCGVSRYDFCTPVLDSVNNSDQAMYQAKNNGKNRCAAV